MLEVACSISVRFLNRENQPWIEFNKRRIGELSRVQGRINGKLFLHDSCNWNKINPPTPNTCGFWQHWRLAVRGPP